LNDQDITSFVTALKDGMIEIKGGIAAMGIVNGTNIIQIVSMDGERHSNYAMPSSSAKRNLC